MYSSGLCPAPAAGHSDARFLSLPIRVDVFLVILIPETRRFGRFAHDTFNRVGDVFTTGASRRRSHGRTEFHARHVHSQIGTRVSRSPSAGARTRAHLIQCSSSRNRPSMVSRQLRGRKCALARPVKVRIISFARHWIELMFIVELRAPSGHHGHIGVWRAPWREKLVSKPTSTAAPCGARAVA